MTCEIQKISLERYSTTFGIGHASPRISWRFIGDVEDWSQKSYHLRIVRDGQEEVYNVESSKSTYLSWPSTPIRSRERLKLSVRAVSTLGTETPWKTVDIERSLSSEEWTASVTFGPRQDPAESKRPLLLRRIFNLESIAHARLYITALGLYEATLNGTRIGDHHLAPGWQSYSHRLHYQTFDIAPALRVGENVLEVWVGEGWYAGRLGWAGGRLNQYGEDIGLLAQMEVGGEVVIQTGEDGWEWAFGSLLTSELYDGESVDLNTASGPWEPARAGPRPDTRLVAPESPPVRQTQTLKPLEIINTPNGARIVDFGQNIVGWVRLLRLPPSSTVILRHAEVLEHGELGTRPLRVCKATDTIVTPTNTPSDSLDKSWEPKFTFHGFRYVQIDGWDDIALNDLLGVVVHSDMERLGDFECSHKWITKFHQNTCEETS